MNTRLILLGLFSLVAVISKAENGINAFKEGSVWTTEYRSWYSSEVDIEDMSIEGETIVNGRSCMNLMRSINGGEKELYAYLSVEGEKVFFIPRDDSSQIFLFYDFGISPSEEVTVFPIHSYSHWENDQFYQICDGISIIHNAGVEHTLLQMREVYCQNGNPEDQYSFEHVWIKGIGSTDGLINNCEKGMTGGLNPKLSSVSVDGNVVYSIYQTDAISEAISSQDYDQCNHTAILYDLSGKRLDALRPGLNVIRLDGKTRIIAQ